MSRDFVESDNRTSQHCIVRYTSIIRETHLDLTTSLAENSLGSLLSDISDSHAYLVDMTSSTFTQKEFFFRT